MANWIRAAQAAARSGGEEMATCEEVDRLCTALLEAAEALEKVEAIERQLYAEGNSRIAHALHRALHDVTGRRVLTRIQADPEVEHG